jgi:hypothetical protein
MESWHLVFPKTTSKTSRSAGSDKIADAASKWTRFVFVVRPWTRLASLILCAQWKFSRVWWQFEVVCLPRVFHSFCLLSLAIKEMLPSIDGTSNAVIKTYFLTQKLSHLYLTKTFHGLPLVAASAQQSKI